MADIIKLLLAFVRDSFRSREQLKAEIIVLRHQLNVLQRKIPKKPQLSGTDKVLFVWLGRDRLSFQALRNTLAGPCGF